MHILLIHQIFIRPEDAGGTRHYEFGRYLVHSGHTITVLAGTRSYLDDCEFPAGKKEVIEPGFEIIRCKVAGSVHRSFVSRAFGFFSFMASSFWQGLKVRKVDVVYGTSPPLFQGPTAWALAALKRVPFVFEVRDLWPYFAVAVGVLTSKPLIWLAEWVEKFLYKRADVLVVNSPGFIDFLRVRGARRIELIPNGVDPDMFYPEDRGTALRKAWGLEDHFVVLYAGAHGLSNDLAVLLDAASELKDRRDIAFVLLGDGKEKAALEKKVETLNLHSVLFLDPVPKTEMPQNLAAADACVAILKPIDAYKTTYPNKVFDYMAAGRPVLLAIDGVIRQVVETANAGLYIPPGDAHALAQAVLEMAENRKRAEGMGVRGRTYVEQYFNRKDQSQAVVDLLEPLAAKPPR
ncbi:MAG: glycosyltransferase family 4 protein [Anaerolineales bacterium]|nr:glycosyltransferase family 4 protein [Anaerolineales bacterium]